jgi:RecA-family ATPase
MADRISDLFKRPTPEHPCYIAGGILPKSGIMLMGGGAKIGKTWLLLDLAHNLAVGGSPWGMFTAPEAVPTLYCEQEVGEMEFQRRVKLKYEALKMDPPENLFYTSRLKGFFLDTAGGQRKLADEISSTKAKVAIVDPVGRCLIGGENDAHEIGALFRGLDELLVSLPGLSIVLSHHFSKPPREDAEGYDPLSPYQFRGSSKWFDAPDTLVTFLKTQQRPGEWLRVKGRAEVRQGPPPEDGDMKLAILPGGLVIPAPEPAAVGGAMKPVLKVKGTW